MGGKTYIIIHHSLTGDGSTVSWNAIRRYHTEEKGWKEIGYHFGVELIGERYEILMGRTPDMPGAHTKELNMNSAGIGICLVGNFDATEPPEAQIGEAIRLAAWLQSVYRIPNNNILGHREIGLLAGYDWTRGQYKSCPGKFVSMENFRKRCLS